MSAHTPGPWSIGEAGEIYCRWPYTSVCMVLGMDDADANARLIAAAPELLDALRLILPLALGYAPEGQSAQARITCNSWIEAAHAAINKATGAA